MWDGLVSDGVLVHSNRYGPVSDGILVHSNRYGTVTPVSSTANFRLSVSPRRQTISRQSPTDITRCRYVTLNLEHGVL